MLLAPRLTAIATSQGTQKGKRNESVDQSSQRKLGFSMPKDKGKEGVISQKQLFSNVAVSAAHSPVVRCICPKPKWNRVNAIRS